MQIVFFFKAGHFLVIWGKHVSLAGTYGYVMYISALYSKLDYLWNMVAQKLQNQIPRLIHKIQIETKILLLKQIYRILRNLDKYKLYFYLNIHKIFITFTFICHKNIYCT